MSKKQLVRKEFREGVFKRDRYLCRCCGKKGKDRQNGDLHLKYHKNPEVELDAHHIISSKELTGGGYVVSNGISVCSECHLKCEEYWDIGVACEGFAQDDLFKLIGSSREKAVQDSDARFGD